MVHTSPVGRRSPPEYTCTVTVTQTLITRGMGSQSVLRVCMQRSLDEVVMFDKEQHAIMGDAHQRERDSQTD